MSGADGKQLRDENGGVRYVPVLPVGIRVLKTLDPMSVLPTFGILVVSAAVIWVGIVVL